MYKNTSFLSVKYRMLSYLNRGLRADRSNIQRKPLIISFFLIYLIIKVYFFLQKLTKHTSFTKYINNKKFCQNLFLELNTLRFTIEKNATEKNGVICTLISCVIWCVDVIPVAFSLFDWETCMELINQNMMIFCLFLNEYFVN